MNIQNLPHARWMTGMDGTPRLWVGSRVLGHVSRYDEAAWRVDFEEAPSIGQPDPEPSPMTNEGEPINPAAWEFELSGKGSSGHKDKIG